MTKGRAKVWTVLDDAVLKALHAKGHSAKFIAAFMVCGSKLIREKAEGLGLSFRDHHQWTAAQDQVLLARYPDEPASAVADALGLTVAQVHRRANRLGVRKSETFFDSDRSGRVQRGRTDPRLVANQFPKGHVPANKGLRRPGWAPGRMAETQFKKGSMSGAAQHNYVPIGTERISKDGYLERKVTDDHPVPARRWVAVHRLVWEATHGPVPPGHAVAFLPGRRTADASAITLDAIELVSRRELMRRNSYHTNYPKEVAQLIQLKGALNRKINRRSKQA